MAATSLQRLLMVMSLAAMAAISGAAFAADPKPSGNWRIAFNHATENDGAIVFRIAPLDGTPIDVEVKVPANTSENNVAELTSAAIKASVGSDNYRVGVDDGEDVVIRKRGKTKNFVVTMVSTTLTGLEIKVGRN
jgi:ABC-type sugar transport system substrate-binding protein